MYLAMSLFESEPAGASEPDAQSDDATPATAAAASSAAADAKAPASAADPAPQSRPRAPPGSPPFAPDESPVAWIVVGMAGSGKSTLMQRLNAHVHERKVPS